MVVSCTAFGVACKDLLNLELESFNFFLSIKSILQEDSVVNKNFTVEYKISFKKPLTFTVKYSTIRMRLPPTVKGVIFVLRNLKAEMARSGVSTEMIMNVLGRSDKTTRDKINGKSGLYLSEAVKIRDALFPGMSIEYLFQSDNMQ